MNQNERPRNYLIGLIAGLIFALSISWPLWKAAADLDISIQSQASEYASEHSKHGKVAVSQECTAIAAPAIKQNCIAQEAKPYREAERNERDLEAQQIMANWTRVMGKAAIIGMGVGIVGLFLIFVTFWETRKAADAGREANAIAKDQQRARIAPFASVRPETLSRSTFIFGCENVGNSPAFNLRCAIKFEKALPNHLPSFGDWGEARVVKAGEKVTLTVGEMSDIKGMLVGCISYDTLFEKDRIAYVCFEFQRSSLNGRFYAVDRTPQTWPAST